MSPVKLGPREQQIMDALYSLGRVATTRQVSILSNVPMVNVHEFLDGFSEYVRREKGEGYDASWRIFKHYYKEN
jgi:hypothetical protein